MTIISNTNDLFQWPPSIKKRPFTVNPKKTVLNFHNLDFGKIQNEVLSILKSEQIFAISFVSKPDLEYQRAKSLQQKA